VNLEDFCQKNLTVVNEVPAACVAVSMSDAFGV